MENTFEEWYENSAIVDWLKLNKDLARDIWDTAWKAGYEACYIEGDYEDELREQEQLRRGEA